MIELLSYGFMQRALIGGLAIALICALIGTFLVLRRLSLLGDGLAHVSFGGIAVGILLGVNPLIAALVTAVLASLWIQKIVGKSKLYGDAATAVILTFGIGVAITIIGIAKGFTVDLFSYLFGSILAISKSDLLLIFSILAVVLTFTLVYYKRLVFISFNEEMARLSGIRVDLINTLFSIMMALAVVISIRAVGILLVSALLVLPAITALQISSSFKKTLILSAVFSTLSVVIGTISSFYLNLPPGGIIAVLMCGVFTAVSLVKK